MKKEMEFFVRTDDGHDYSDATLSLYVDTQKLSVDQGLKEFLQDIKRAYKSKRGKADVKFTYIAVADSEQDLAEEEGLGQFDDDGYFKANPGYEYYELSLLEKDIKRLENLED